MRRLHEITSDIAALEAALFESGGEWTPEVEASFGAVDCELEQKVDGYAALIAEWSADAEKWKAEEARVAGHRRALENAAKRLKDRLCSELVAIGREKVETPRFKVAVQRAAPTVEVSGLVTELPPEFQRVIPATVEVDKQAIAAALKASPNGMLSFDEGDYEIVYAQLKPGTPYLRIR